MLNENWPALYHMMSFDPENKPLLTQPEPGVEFRIDHLRRTAAQIKFLSLEPLLGPVGKLNLREIDWVIVGGESGPRSRPMEKCWVTDVRDQCKKICVPFFFKQWGGPNKKKAGRELDGREWDEMPDVARLKTIRQQVLR